MYLFYSIILTIFIVIIGYFFSMNLSSSYISKSSPFECGFYPFSGLSTPFSMPFFVISLMFLLFDVEILLMCFFPLFYFSLYFMGGCLAFILFFMFFSTIYEWMKGILMWV